MRVLVRFGRLWSTFSRQKLCLEGAFGRHVGRLWSLLSRLGSFFGRRWSPLDAIGALGRPSAAKAQNNQLNLINFRVQNRHKSTPKTKKVRQDTTSTKQHKIIPKTSLRAQLSCWVWTWKTWFRIGFSYIERKVDCSKTRLDLELTLYGIRLELSRLLIDFCRLLSTFSRLDWSRLSRLE